MYNKLLLLGIIFLSLIGKNKPMTIGGIIVLILSFINNQSLNRYLKDNLIDIGLIFLMVWLLLPIIDNNTQIHNPKAFININGIVSFLCGLFVVTVAGKGLSYLNANTPAIGGIILGSIIGVLFFDGIPVGMLTASGIAYLIIKIIKVLS